MAANMGIFESNFLIVDDNPVNRLIIGKFLKNTKVEDEKIQYAVDAKAGFLAYHDLYRSWLNAQEETLPPVVITDFNMKSQSNEDNVDGSV